MSCACKTMPVSPQDNGTPDGFGECQHPMEVLETAVVGFATQMRECGTMGCTRVQGNLAEDHLYRAGQSDSYTGLLYHGYCLAFFVLAFRVTVKD